MKRKFLLITLSIVLVLALAACGKKTAFEVLNEGYTKSTEVNSFEYQGKLALLASSGSPDVDSQEGMVLQLLNNAELSYKGIYNKKLKQQSLTLDLVLKGDMSMNVSIPVVLTATDLYLKIPQTSFLPLPEEVAGKYVHLTMKELEELTGEKIGEDLFSESEVDKKATKELADVLTKHYKEDKILQLSDETKPNGVKELVEINVTNENLHAVLTKLVRDVMPELLKVLSKPEYKDFSGVDKSVVEEFNKSLGDFDKSLEEVKKNTNIKNLRTLIGTNKNGYFSFVKQETSIEITNESKTKSTVGLTFEMNMSKFNEDLTITKPEDKDTINFEELNSIFMEYGLDEEVNEETTTP